MIELYTWTTPNGQKVSIMLEEVGLPYRVHPIDITKDEQFAPAFLKIAPNNKIPAIVDTDNGFHLMESGAILMYLADKTGRLWPQEFPVKWRVVEWLMWQMGGPGPFLGQVHHFVRFNPGKSSYAEERYAKEAKRLWGVLDRRLARGRVCRRRLLHRRYRHLALDLAFRLADGGVRRPSQCKALVFGDRRPAGGQARLGCVGRGPRHPHAVNSRRTPLAGHASTVAEYRPCRSEGAGRGDRRDGACPMGQREEENVNDDHCHSLAEAHIHNRRCGHARLGAHAEAG